MKRTYTLLTSLFVWTFVATQAGIAAKAAAPSPNDPFMQTKQATDQVRQWEQRVVELLTTIRARLEKTKAVPAPVVQATATFDDFKKLLTELRVPAKWLMENRPQFEDALKSYEGSLTKAIPALEQAADKYWSIARTYPEGSLLYQHYAVLGHHGMEAARSLRDRSTTLAKNRQEIATKLAFVEQSVLYLDRLEFFLEMYPANSEAARKIDFYLQQLNAYMQQFEQTVAVFQAFSQTLTGPAKATNGSPAAPAQKAQKTSAAS